MQEVLPRFRSYRSRLVGRSIGLAYVFTVSDQPSSFRSVSDRSRDSGPKAHLARVLAGPWYVLVAAAVEHQGASGSKQTWDFPLD